MIQVKTKKTTEEVVSIETPCFFKSGADYMAVYDESDVIKFYRTDTYSAFQSSDSDFFAHDIATAYNKWDKISESQFRYEYEKALKQIAIPRKEITTGELYEETELLKTFH